MSVEKIGQLGALTNSEINLSELADIIKLNTTDNALNAAFVKFEESAVYEPIYENGDSQENESDTDNLSISPSSAHSDTCEEAKDGNNDNQYDFYMKYVEPENTFCITIENYYNERNILDDIGTVIGRGIFDIFNKLNNHSDGTVVMKAEVDTNGDGKPDEIWETEYKNGKAIRVKIDKDCDGKADEIREYEYNAESTNEKLIIDKNGDGKPDEIWETEYKNGKAIRVKIDKDCDGKADEIREYTYDNEGKNDNLIIDKNGDGKPDEIWKYTYSSDGTEKIEIDKDNDGKADEIITNKYGGDGRLIKKIIDKNGDGKPDEIWIYKDGEPVTKINPTGGSATQ